MPQHRYTRLKSPVLSAIALFTLISCGGGGGSGSNPPSQPISGSIELVLPSGEIGQSLQIQASANSALRELQWQKTAGPGAVHFQDDSAAQTSATFSHVGTYTLKATAKLGNTTVEKSGTVVITPDDTPENGTVSGIFSQWQAIQVDFNGPNSDEKANSPNPFLDYRYTLDLTAPSGKQWSVPGYFDGDGKGGSSGTVFRAKFTPDEVGTWQYKANFHAGIQVALETTANPGSSAEFHGKSGQFSVTSPSKDSQGFARYGRLKYAGNHYLKYQDGPYWLKSGTNSPEDWLAYDGFDNTPPTEDFSRHARFVYHRKDWQSGDPDWQQNEQWPAAQFPANIRPNADVQADGKGIIGAINYLANNNVNSIYFIFMNIGGDGMNVWPYPYSAERVPTQEEFNNNPLTALCTPTAEFLCPGSHPQNDNLHFDISKMQQWAQVFQHAQNKGMLLHTVFSEARRYNKEELDGSNALGVERKLYFREMVARFAHHNGLQWNISEEYDLDTNSKQRDLPNTPEEVIDYANYIAALDPYDHPITVLNTDIPGSNIQPFYNKAHFDTTSLQYYETYKTVGADVERLRQETQASGKPLPINVDEPMWVDAESDDGTPLTKYRHELDDPVMTPDEARKGMIWDVYFSGAAGIEWYSACRDTRFDDKDLGYAPCASEDYQGFYSFEPFFRYTGYARKLLEQELPFWEMTPQDQLLSNESQHARFGGAEVFAKVDHAIAIYYPIASQTGTLNLATSTGSNYELRWFNPRTGQFEGNKYNLSASNAISMPAVPTNPNEDWVAILIKQG